MRMAWTGPLVAGICFIVLALLPPLWLWSSTKTHPHGADVRLAVREQPLVLDFFPMKTPLSDQECRRAGQVIRPYFKKATLLYSTGRDLYGNSFGPFTVDSVPSIPATTKSSLSDVADTEFWSPYQ